VVCDLPVGLQRDIDPVRFGRAGECVIVCVCAIVIVALAASVPCGLVARWECVRDLAGRRHRRVLRTGPLRPNEIAVLAQLVDVIVV
jgi:hypothetical protein